MRLPTIPFIGLAEGAVLTAIRRSGVPMQRIRPALEQLDAQIGLSPALASRRLYTDVVADEYGVPLDRLEDAVRIATRAAARPMAGRSAGPVRRSRPGGR